VPAWEFVWKGRALGRISRDRVGLWRHDLSCLHVQRLERYGGRALKDLGYELATDGSTGLPWWFYPRLAARSLAWFLRRPNYPLAKTLWLDRQAARVGQAFDRVGVAVPERAHDAKPVLQRCRV
jgi:hypothetical protein